MYGPPLFAGERIILAGFSGEMVALGFGGRYIAGRGSWHRSDVEGAIVGGATLAGRIRFAFGTTEQRLYVRSVVDGAGGAGLAGRWSRPSMARSGPNPLS